LIVNTEHNATANITNCTLHMFHLCIPVCLDDSMNSTVTSPLFIMLFTIQIVSKQHCSDNRKIMQQSVLNFENSVKIQLK